MLPAMTPVSLKKKTEFLRGKLEGMIGVQVISYLFVFSLSVVLDLALKPYGSVTRTSRTKARFWSSDRSIAELKVNKIKL